MPFQHLQDVCLSYYEHMRFSLYLSREFFQSSLQAVVHAFVPSLYVTSSSDMVQRVTMEMAQIGCRDITEQPPTNEATNTQHNSE